ncbi:SulP family inorganic anion transporter [Desulfocurvus sp. DL9XJH121]
MLTKILPFLGWFKGYGAAKFKLDAVAGITVALVLIPQSMAYAQLAGLPAYYGLYASFLPPMIAALFGSSRQLATGPVAVVSLMTAASLEPLAAAGSEGYIAYAILLAILVGLFQLSLGILRLGLVVNFLSHPVVNGFTNAAALIIASSQLSKMFGVYVDKAEHHYETIIRVVESAAQYTHWPTLGMGVLAFLIMWGLKRISPKLPAVLVAVVVTTAMSWGLNFQHDAKVEIAAIHSEAAHRAVTDFNSATLGLEELAGQRTSINASLAQAQMLGDFDKANDAEHDLMSVNHQIAALKEAAHESRTKLRAMLFTGLETGGRGLELVERDSLPAGTETDGRTWRIKVGNKPLDASSLTVMGGGAVVGSIPKGLPAFTVPSFDMGIIMHLLSYAAIISLLGFMEAISIAKAMAAKTGQRLDPNQELIGQGLANILGALTRSYPSSGSFSRSAVNLQAGAVTGLSSVFTSVMVVIVLLFFTPLLYHLPQSVLAAVIMMAVIGLLNVSGFVHAWKAQWYDGAISVLSFVATLAFAPHLDKGIMIGVVLSLGVFLYKSMRPRVRSLSLAEDEALRCAEEYCLMECEYVDVIRFDGPLFFANASFLEDKITERMRMKEKLRHIVLVASGVNDMDASGEETLSLVIDRCRQAGVDISLSGANESVMQVLRRTHLLEKIGEDHVHASTERALKAVHHAAHQAGDEANCPLTSVCYNV